MAKGIEIFDIWIGTGEEALPGKTVVLNLRMFLRQGEEVFIYPEPRVKIDLKGRHCIAGLRKGIIGMRAGGIRTITIAPTSPTGQKGCPEKFPPMLRFAAKLSL
jgi:FKBP-type peptidyl-prolyl cis-trans isomerase